jgi:hypothetical protein
MFTVYKKKDSNGVEFSYLKLTEDQLAQLAQVPRGKSLFGCVVLHSGVRGSRITPGYPWESQVAYQLVFQYQDTLFGTEVGIKPGQEPWVRGTPSQKHDIEELAPTFTTTSRYDTLNSYAHPEVYLIRIYP